MRNLKIKNKFYLLSHKTKKNLINPKVGVFNNKINKVEDTKFLGLSLDAHLSWGNHIQPLKTNFSGLFVFRSKSKFCLCENTKMIYYIAHILFGLFLYGGTSVAS